MDQLIELEILLIIWGLAFCLLFILMVDGVIRRLDKIVKALEKHDSQ